MRKNVCILLCALCCFSACTVRPRKVLSKRQMTEVLYDLHRADGILQAAGYNYGKDEELAKYYQQVLDRHGITQAQFDSSLVWYTAHPKQFKIVYPKVVERLKAEKEELTALNGQHFAALQETKNAPALSKIDTDSLFRTLTCGLPDRWLLPVRRDTLPADSAFVFPVLMQYQDSIWSEHKP